MGTLLHFRLEACSWPAISSLPVSTPRRKFLTKKCEELLQTFRQTGFVTLQPADRLDFADDVMKLGQVRQVGGTDHGEDVLRAARFPSSTASGV